MHSNRLLGSFPRLRLDLFFSSVLEQNRMTDSNCLFEVCVDSLESARNAEKGGAHRLELCSSLSLGGLTPTVGFVNAVKSHISIPTFAMIRPREGDFVYDESELTVMEEDIKALKECRIDGFVFGILRSDGSIDRDACLRLIRLAHPLPCTFHRAFDVARNPVELLEEVIQLGFRRILTSGQRETAEAGADLIATLQGKAAGRIIIMAGAGITESNAARVWNKTRVGEIHGSAAQTRPTAGQKNAVAMGTGPEVCQKRVTSAEIVERIVKSLTICSGSSMNH